MGTTYHACSFSAPPLAQARQGSPERCCVNSRTTPAAPGQEGSSTEKEAGGQGGSGWGSEGQGSLHIPSQPGGHWPLP